MPSMSFGPSPASFIAFRAASACRPICDNSGMRPSSVVSAAAAMAIDFGFMCLTSRRAEQWQCDLVVDLLEGDFERHVEDESFGSLRAIDDVAHHPRPLVELDNRERVRRGGARHRPAVDHI